MRRYLSPELRRRFDIAWRILPETVREDLKSFIHYVRSARSLAEAQIVCADGTLIRSEQDVGGWFVIDRSSSSAPGHIFLNSDFENGPEALAVLTILHELAHAVEYLEDDWHAGSRAEHLSDAAAWFQVAAWVARDTSKYAKSRTVAMMAARLAWEEILAWPSD